MAKPKGPKPLTAAQVRADEEKKRNERRQRQREARQGIRSVRVIVWVLIYSTGSQQEKERFGLYLY